MRSTRLLERQSKIRKVPHSKVTIPEKHSLEREEIRRRINEEYDPNDPLRLFLGGPETRKLLTVEEESELIVQIQVYY